MSKLDEVLNNVVGASLRSDNIIGEARAELSKLRNDLSRLANHRSEMDCSYAGIDLAEASLAHHCPIDRPCSRYGYEKQIDAAAERVAALEKACEAGDALVSSADYIVALGFPAVADRSQYEDDVIEALASYRAAREACR